MHLGVAFGKQLLCALLIIALVAGCAFFKRLFSTKNVEPPSIELFDVEVLQKSELWFYSEDIEPTKGEAGNHGAPMALVFVFNLKNPNNTPVLLSEFNFTVELQNFKLDEVKSKEQMWIPANETNQLRVFSYFDVQSARLNLLVQGGQKLLEESETKPKEKGDKKKEESDKKEDGKENWLWRTLEEYWRGLPESKIPISVVDGAAVFEAKGVTVSVPVSGEYPRERK